MKKVCLQCGEEINPKTPWGKFCDNKCQGKYRRAHPNYPPCICKGCGIEFIPKAKDRTTYHSRECAFKDKAAKPKEKQINIRICVICGKEFEGRLNAKCCCDECKKKYRHNQYLEYKQSKKYTDDLTRQRSKYKPKEKYTKTCVNCGQAFIANRYSQVCCVDCIDEHQSSNRKIHKGGVSKAKRSRVYNRDGFKCKLCGKKLRMDKADTVWTGKPHPLAPTVDHIIPKSIAKELGWSKQEMNAESNLQAAHFSCNVKKGNKVNSTGEQLLLFG